MIKLISYVPLLKQLVEKKMTKTQLREAVGLSMGTLARISKDEYISLENIDKICQCLDCRIDEVIEYVPQK